MEGYRKQATLIVGRIKVRELSWNQERFISDRPVCLQDLHHADLVDDKSRPSVAAATTIIGAVVKLSLQARLTSGESGDVPNVVTVVLL